MDDNLTSSPSQSRGPLPWLLIIGLASLSLLWPLTALWQIGQGPPRAAAILTLTAAVWIGVVGVGRIPRPVLTLALTGLLHGVVGLLVGWLLPDGSGSAAGTTSLWLMLPSLATSAGIGALLGLVALAVQSVLGPRPGGSAPARRES